MRIRIVNVSEIGAHPRLSFRAIDYVEKPSTPDPDDLEVMRIREEQSLKRLGVPTPDEQDFEDAEQHRREED